MKIYENAIPPSLMARLEREFDTIPWFFVDNTAYGNQNDNASPLNFSWQHVTMIDKQPNSYISSLVETIIMATLDNCGIEYSEILRSRFGLTTASSTNIVHEPHIDREEFHKVGLIYLNNCDGDTLLYKEKYDINSGLSSLDYYNSVLNKKLTIEERIQPSRNKMISFDGNVYHSSSCPTKVNKRIILNFNFR